MGEKLRAIWRRVSYIGKEKVFTVKVGQTFNLETITGLPNWGKTKFIISIPKYRSKSGLVDTRVKIVETRHPNYKVQPNNSEAFESNSYIDVYAIETEQRSNNKRGSWVKIKEFVQGKRDRIFAKVSSRNNYTFSLKSTENINDYDVLYSFTSLNLPMNTIGYYFSYKSIGGNKFKVYLTILQTKITRKYISTRRKLDITVPTTNFGILNLSFSTLDDTHEWTHHIGGLHPIIYLDGKRKELTTYMPQQGTGRFPAFSHTVSTTIFLKGKNYKLSFYGNTIDGADRKVSLVMYYGDIDKITKKTIRFEGTVCLKRK